VSGRYLVGRDVIAELGIVGRIPGVPGQVFAGELTLDQFRVFGEEKNAPLQASLVGAFVDFSIQQGIDHIVILTPADANSSRNT